MKIAMAASDKSLDSLVDARFGRCPFQPFILWVKKGKDQ